MWQGSPGSGHSLGKGRKGGCEPSSLPLALQRKDRRSDRQSAGVISTLAFLFCQTWVEKGAEEMCPGRGDTYFPRDTKTHRHSPHRWKSHPNMHTPQTLPGHTPHTPHPICSGILSPTPLQGLSPGGGSHCALPCPSSWVDICLQMTVWTETIMSTDSRTTACTLPGDTLLS